MDKPRIQIQILRFVIALLFALSVMGITLYVGWREENSLQRAYRASFLANNFRTLDEMVEIYRQKHNRLPQKISDLEEQEMYHRLASSGVVMDDYWRKPIVYKSDGSRYVFVSYGRDGKPGGEGLDMDISSDNPKPKGLAITFSQFLTYWRTQSIASWGQLLGVIAFFLALLATRPVAVKRGNIGLLIMRLFAFGFVLLLVTGFLTMFHVHAAHSGH